MKKFYNAPEFELLDILSEDVLDVSDEENGSLIDDPFAGGDDEDPWGWEE